MKFNGGSTWHGRIADCVDRELIIYMQKTRKILASKIEQLNSAIDDVSSQLRPEYTANGEASGQAGDVESVI